MVNPKQKKETATQKKRRLEKARENYKLKSLVEDQKSKRLRLDRNKANTAKRRSNQTSVEREYRLMYDKIAHSNARAVETPQHEEARLSKQREYDSVRRATETLPQREKHLSQMRVRNAEVRASVGASIEAFTEAINTFCDQICAICTKRCYSYQVDTYKVDADTPQYVAQNLPGQHTLLLCNRCIAQIKRDKVKSPSKAFWNNLLPGDIPIEIADLSQAEQRLISRVIPFVKIIKLGGRFGQYSFRGQAILFAQDIFEVTEKLPAMLPRSSEESGLVIITEFLENMEYTREFCVRRDKVNAALRWLIQHNPLYGDVIIDENVRLNEQDFIRITEQSNNVERLSEEVIGLTSNYKTCSPLARILRGSFHQGSVQFFDDDFAGKQCCAMVLTNIVRASFLSPNNWTANIVNSNLIAGHNLYTLIRETSEHDAFAISIPASGFLEIRNLNVIKEKFELFNRKFSINYNENTLLVGNLKDNHNGLGGPGMTLKNALTMMFVEHNGGILIAASKCLGVLQDQGKFYFTDSHMCGPAGSPAQVNGCACIIECETLDELVRICKRAIGRSSTVYELNYIDVRMEEDASEQLEIEEANASSPEIQMASAPSATISHVQTTQHIPIQTSVMAPIDVNQPSVDEEYETSDKLNKITRKTKDNIVNVEREVKFEEFAWYFLFPNGVNGLSMQRPVKITPLDYFQYRVMGHDTRFQRNDYLFYALSLFEYLKIKENINACGKKIQGRNGMVEDFHLYVKNLRGSASYWQNALRELIAQIKCLGSPTFFLTFSSNDLNWLDMRKALLIADGRPDVDPSTLDMFSTQPLVEKYPIIVVRHFMNRVNALMRFILNDHNVLGGRVVDFWWRIEFQNRGSPHLHMVLWVDKFPSFDTEEGIRLIDQVITCEMPPDGSANRDLVDKCQRHRHTQSCTKNHTATRCRFAFPRQECDQTRMVENFSTESIRNGGRTCLLKRRKEDIWVNNYNVTLLTLWEGNMDIQPCGTDESIAYYIAKYVSKAEPVQLDSAVAQAIKQIQRENTDTSRKIFKICMRIMNERQVSACECAYRLCGLPLIDSSRKCIFLNARKPLERYRVVKFDKVTKRAVDYCANIFDRYEKRPFEHNDYDFVNMCLLEFAMLFEPHYAKQVNEDANEDGDSRKKSRKRLLTLTDNSKMVIRNRPAVIRVPYFVAHNDPENYYYSLLVQYRPFRLESQLLQGFDSSLQAFQANEEIMRAVNQRMEKYRTLDHHLENAFNQLGAFDILERIPPPPFEELADLEEDLPDQALSREQFERGLGAMNMTQRQIFECITNSCFEQLNSNKTSEKSKNDRLKLFITGNAGTGKTFLFKLLQFQINNCFGGKRVVKVCALTGVAARLVGGSTLHSTLRLPVQKDGAIVQLHSLTGNYLEKMRQEWKNIEFIFIDEVSMIPYEMFCMVNLRLKQLKNNDELFGGINVILFGDLLQLEPVRGNQIFQQPSSHDPAVHLWRLFRMVELTENMRQHGDTTFVDILNALRVGKIRAKHLDVLLQKVSSEWTGEFSIEKALRIYPTNEQVTEHNRKVLEHFRAKQAPDNVRIYMIRALDKLIDATAVSDDAIDSYISNDINKTGGFPKELEIFRGAKVMLRSNINVSKGLVNGAIGFISEIIWPYFRRDQMHDKDIPIVEVDFGKDVGVHRIEPKAIQFPAKKGYTAERYMLPLVLSWASTVHKMQGSTVDYAVVYLGKKLFADGQAYVALSRVRSLDGLRIEELECSKLEDMKPCNEEALAEMDRLRSIN